PVHLRDLYSFPTRRSSDLTVRVVQRLAALFLNDLAQRGVDVFGHAFRVAAHKKLRAFAVNPLPNLSRVLQQFSLHVNFVRLIPRDRKSTRLNSSHLVISYA